MALLMPSLRADFKGAATVACSDGLVVAAPRDALVGAPRDAIVGALPLSLSVASVCSCASECVCATARALLASSLDLLLQILEGQEEVEEEACVACAQAAERRTLPLPPAALQDCLLICCPSPEFPV